MKVVDVHEAKKQLSRLLERAHRGERVVISKGGKPYARLVPLEPAPARKPGWLLGSVGKAFRQPLPAEELDRWEGK